VSPKFLDSNKQNVVQFLSELDEYYRLKNVSESLKLPIAMKAVSDDYSRQWIATVYDLADYSQFKKAFTDLLWSPQVQSQVRSRLYHDRFAKNGNESLSIHFLRYSVVAANLAPKVEELHLVDATAGHHPPRIQRALLSAGVRVR